MTLVAPVTAKRRRSGAELRRRREALTAYLLIAPAFLLFLGFIAGPLVGGFALSLFNYDLLSPAKYVGLANFRALFHDSLATQALEVTAEFTLASLVLHLVVGLALALAVNRKMPGWLRYILRSAFFFPVLISWAVVSLIAQYTLDPNFGFIPYYLSKIGIPNVGLFTDPHTALPAIIGVDLWHTVGFTFLVLLAGLQAIPSELYEAARVDGIGCRCCRRRCSSSASCRSSARSRSSSRCRSSRSEGRATRPRASSSTSTRPVSSNFAWGMRRRSASFCSPVFCS